MTRLSAAAVSPAGGTVDGGKFEILELDPDVAELIAEVDEILCAALAAIGRPPTPLAIKYALGKSRRLACREVRRCAPRQGPVRPVPPAERGPPGPNAP